MCCRTNRAVIKEAYSCPYWIRLPRGWVQQSVFLTSYTGVGGSLANIVDEKILPLILQSCVYPGGGRGGNNTVKANELVHLCIYQESKLLTFLSSPVQLGSKQVSNLCIIHNSPEKQTLAKGWLLTDVDYVNFLRMAAWFVKIKYKQ